MTKGFNNRTLVISSKTSSPFLSKKLSGSVFPSTLYDCGYMHSDNYKFIDVYVKVNSLSCTSTEFS